MLETRGVYTQCSMQEQLLTGSTSLLPLLVHRNIHLYIHVHVYTQNAGALVVYCGRSYS